MSRADDFRVGAMVSFAHGITLTVSPSFTKLAPELTTFVPGSMPATAIRSPYVAPRVTGLRRATVSFTTTTANRDSPPVDRTMAFKGTTLTRSDLGDAPASSDTIM